MEIFSVGRGTKKRAYLLTSTVWPYRQLEIYMRYPSLDVPSGVPARACLWVVREQSFFPRMLIRFIYLFQDIDRYAGGSRLYATLTA